MSGKIKKGACPRLYGIWKEIKYRCKSKRSKDYLLYGGRGIYVCPEWHDYEAFAADVGPHPGGSWQLDRKDNDGPYCKSNCRWATIAQQAQNRRTTKLSMDKAVLIRRLYQQGYITQRELAKEFGVHQSMISYLVSFKHWKTHVNA